MYKDPDRQREADRARQKRRRDKIKAKGVTNQGVTVKALPAGPHGACVLGIDPTETADSVFEPKRGKDIKALPNKLNLMADVINQQVTGSVKSERTGVNLEALNIAAVPNSRGGHKLVAPIPKRGKGIKCFADLPLDVQQSIDRMSMVDGKIDQTIKANRTAIAVHYQHLFPSRYHSTGVI